MKLGRHTPNSEERAAYAQEVVASLERTALDRATVLVLGGGALALAGIRRANDLDLMIPHAAFTTLAVQRRLPSGLILRQKPGVTRPFLETSSTHLPEDMMSVDITHPHDDLHHQGSPDLDAKFLRLLDSFDHVAGYRFLPPELVAAHKQTDTGINSRKSRQDLRLIRRHLAGK